MKSENFDSRPIGVFDSGIGGITVLKELLRHFPQESFIYLGDTARLPYGSKSPETVRNYTVQNMKYLVSRNVKAIVVACNTASTQVYENEFDGRPIYNVIDPGSKLAAEATQNNKIAVLATRATVAAGSYTKKIHLFKPEAEVFSRACPLFVPLAEEGLIDDPITNLIAYRYLNDLKANDVDTVVLGCTHYPLLKSSIAKVFGLSVSLIDSGEAVARQVDVDFSTLKIKPNSPSNPTRLTVALTDKSLHFENLTSNLLQSVSTEEIHFETVSVI